MWIFRTKCVTRWESTCTPSDMCMRTQINPFMTSGLFYLIFSDRSMSDIRGVWLVFINTCTMFYRNSCIWCKQCRPWSDAVFCGVWSGSTLFANVPFMGRRALNGLTCASVQSVQSLLLISTTSFFFFFYQIIWEMRVSLVINLF